jgi:hypothetical protein
MRKPLDTTRLLKEQEVVGEKLASRTLTRERRMELLRRQAELGDLREAIAQRARRNPDR